jgi:molybdopterin converting factor small subunit
MTIRVKVELMSALKHLHDRTNFEVELPDRATVEAMLRSVFKGAEIEHLRVFVSGEQVSLNKVLKDGDEVWVGVIVGGG